RFVAPRSRFEHALRRALLDLARSYPFARQIVNMGRMSLPFSYAASPLTTIGGEALPNVAITLADGCEGSLAGLLRGEGPRFLVLVGPNAAAPRPTSTLFAAYAVGKEQDGLPVISGYRLGTPV